MPLPIPATSPPKPPDTAAGHAQERVDALTKYTRTQAVYLDRLLTELRTTVNWVVTQQPVRNLVPDSDLLDATSTWTVGPGWVVTDAVGEGGGRGFTLTGAPAGTLDATSGGIIVQVGGNQYVLSGWIDARHLLSGTLSWIVRDRFAPFTVFAAATQTLGQTGRVQVLANLPSTVLQVVVAARAINVVTGPTGIIVSQPQLELQRAGHAGITTPQATLYRSGPEAVAAAPIPPTPPVLWRQHVLLIGPRDGVNTIFTTEVPIAFDSNGEPLAQLIWRRAYQFYTTTNPPLPGEWTMTDASTVIVGEPPESGDAFLLSPAAVA